jgi:hypothetical protein
MSGTSSLLTAQQAALQLALLFHSGEPWTHQREIAWANLIRTIEQETGRTVVQGRIEATTRVLCDAIRAALEECLSPEVR